MLFHRKRKIEVINIEKQLLFESNRLDCLIITVRTHEFMCCLNFGHTYIDTDN